MDDYRVGLLVMAQVRDAKIPVTATVVRLRLATRRAELPSVARIRGRLGSLACAHLLSVVDTDNNPHPRCKAPAAFALTEAGAAYLDANQGAIPANDRAEP